MHSLLEYDPACLVNGLAGLLACFTLVCELRPREASRWNANAWSSQVEYNFGPKSFEFQAVLFNLFHTSLWCQLTHYSLFADGLAWFHFLYYYCGQSLILQAVFWLVFFVMTLQTITYVKWFIVPFMYLFYFALVAGIPQLPLHWIPWILILSPSIRATGHTLFEPAPPQMFDGEKPKMTFRQSSTLVVFLKYARFHPGSLLWAPFIGWISELQAGLPFRLLPVATLYFLPRSWTRHCIATSEMPALFDWKRVDSAAKSIIQSGWSGWPETRALFL